MLELLNQTDEYLLVAGFEVLLGLVWVYGVYRLKMRVLRFWLTVATVFWVSLTLSTPGGGGSLASELFRKATGRKDPAVTLYRMRANVTVTAAVHHRGGARVRQMQLPCLLPGQALIQMHAAGLNPVDYKLRWDLFPGLRWDEQNLIIGQDLAGVVVEVNSKCERFKVGDRVWGKAKLGSLASFMIADCEMLTLIPDNLDFTQAASLYVAAVTDYAALRHSAHLQPGQNLLVVGASGGCGSLGVMMGKQLGASVTAIASGTNQEAVLSYGADRFVDYTVPQQMAQFLKEKQGQFDIILDTVSSRDGPDPDYEAKLRVLLKPQTGMYLALNGAAEDFARTLISNFLGLLIERPNYHLVIPLKADHHWLDEISTWLKQGTHVRAVIDHVRPFSEEEVNKALQYLKTRRAKGKVVITFPDSLHQ
eukprot:gb/GEZN01007808.1/.p1 GENE.gb/GEZN01007808.1/~~gb/GEZN01007808.1/.p1  ORF type:complete len:421 (+),score=84.17 gb/GEZN01007808.1/:75-1337(+)